MNVSQKHTDVIADQIVQIVQMKITHAKALYQQLNVQSVNGDVTMDNVFMEYCVAIVVLTVMIDLMRIIVYTMLVVLAMISHVEMGSVFQSVDVVMVFLIVMIILMKGDALVS